MEKEFAEKPQNPGKTLSPDALPPHGTALDRYDVAILGACSRRAAVQRRAGGAHRPVGRAHLAAREVAGEQGYITGYRAEIDRRKIGLGVLAFVRVDAERNNAEATRALEDAIRALPEVVACHYISGAGTFELQVVTTDLDAYSRWAMDTLFKLPNVKDLHTSFSLGEVKAGARCRWATCAS
jgi:Lrp/AsnC family leucine-responsive transcriptional regulator